VIGRGPLGSAAARHLAEQGVSTALIGAPEPADRATSHGPFSSHADAGRITRIAAKDLVWAELARRSIFRYGDIARRAGVPFHVVRGLVVCRADVDCWIDAGLINGSNIRRVDAGWVREATGIQVGDGLPLAYEGSPAGYIQPRRLVDAECRLAAAAGATLVDGVVERAAAIAGGYEVSGSWGAIRADRMLLATGAFGRDLLDGQLRLERLGRTIVMAEMADTGALPALILDQPADTRLEHVYWVPPAPYPGGRMCIKIGGNLVAEQTLDTDADLADWFHGDGDPVEAEALEATLRALLPDLPSGPVSTAPCVISRTPTERPYIGWVHDAVAVAIGGNGEAAKSADEIGRLAASLFTPEGWTDTLDQSLFTPPMV
jgi:sarcosine oxidase